MPKWLLYVLAYVSVAGAFLSLVGSLYYNGGLILLTILCVVIMVVSVGVARKDAPTRY